MNEGSEAKPVEEGDEHFPIVAHVVPFVAWIFMMQMLGDPAGWKYAVRTVGCLLLFCWLRPWRWYPKFNPANLGWSLIVGVGVFVMWIAGESDFVQRWPALADVYLVIGLQPPWRLTQPEINDMYAPALAGWPMTIVRIAGSALVISFIEEFFYRGFVYRWLLAKEFLEVALDRLDVRIFLVVALAFGLSHHRWLAGFLTGIAYGWMLLRTKDIWAVGIAHGITNLLLGMYVVWAEKWEFWS